MSHDAKATKHLIRTLEDGKHGYTAGAEKLRSLDRADLATLFDTHAQQRARFGTALETMAAEYGDDIDEDGTALAAAHRGWMTIKDAVAGSSPDGVLDAAVQGDDHAIGVYEHALSEDISADLRDTVQGQLAEIKSARDDVAGRREQS